MHVPCLWNVLILVVSHHGCGSFGGPRGSAFSALARLLAGRGAGGCVLRDGSGARLQRLLRLARQDGLNLVDLTLQPCRLLVLAGQLTSQGGPGSGHRCAVRLERRAKEQGRLEQLLRRTLQKSARRRRGLSGRRNGQPACSAGSCR